MTQIREPDGYYRLLRPKGTVAFALIQQFNRMYQQSPGWWWWGWEVLWIVGPAHVERQPLFVSPQDLISYIKYELENKENPCKVTIEIRENDELDPFIVRRAPITLQNWHEDNFLKTSLKQRLSRLNSRPEIKGHVKLVVCLQA